ncbi:MAG: extracellular solute-binding protein family 5, partial [Deltaproteobacteria bacterium]|nr:extracellular solute-binding protein family 5 [Deltaproteobacteria bacterium]
AKELLKKANCDFNQTVQMRTPHGRYLFDQQGSAAVQASRQARGVKTELEVFLLGWGPIVLDADFGLYGQFHSSVNPPNGLGSAFYSNPEYDKIMDASRLEQNSAKRLEILKKASEMVWDDAPWIWLHVEKFVIAYSSKIKGMVVTGTEKFYPTYIKMQ